MKIASAKTWLILFFSLITASLTDNAKAEEIRLTCIIPASAAAPVRRPYCNTSGNVTLNVAYPAILYKGTPESGRWIPRSGSSYPGAVSIPVQAGDIVEVTCAGNVFGSAVATIKLLSGSADQILNQEITTAQNNFPNVWKEYTVKGIFKATATGVLTFTHQFWLSDYPFHTDITLTNWSTCAEVVESATKSG